MTCSCVLGVSRVLVWYVARLLGAERPRAGFGHSRATAYRCRGVEIDAWYPGRTHWFGGNVRALMDVRGAPRRIYEVFPGSEYGLTAAREPVPAILWPYTKDMPVLADGGYVGAGRGVLAPAPRRGDGLPPHAGQCTFTKLLRGPRCPGERGFALPAGRWTISRHGKIGPLRITDLARAAFVLTHVEHGLIS